MSGTDKPFVVLYRWRIIEGREVEFIDAWKAVTRHFIENCGSLGSRLHKGNDGVFYAYAMWPSREARERAFLDNTLGEAASVMRRAEYDRLPEVELDLIADLLVS